MLSLQRLVSYTETSFCYNIIMKYPLSTAPFLSSAYRQHVEVEEGCLWPGYAAEALGGGAEHPGERWRHSEDRLWRASEPALCMRSGVFIHFATLCMSHMSRTVSHCVRPKFFFPNLSDNNISLKGKPSFFSLISTRLSSGCSVEKRLQLLPVSLCLCVF